MGIPNYTKEGKNGNSLLYLLTKSGITRAQGLISDQVASLTFQKDGTLWLAYACGGVAQGSPADKYSQWETTQAPWYWDSKNNVRQPTTSSGNGLPSNLCNSIFSASNDEIMVGTCSGLTFLPKSGKGNFLRGADFQAKNEGNYKSKSSKNTNPDKLLNDDYVTTLSETEEGIWIGFRNGGALLMDKKTHRILDRVQDSPKTPMSHSWVTTIIPLPDGGVIGGTYGGGIVQLKKGSGKWTKKVTPLDDFPPFPARAKILSLQEIQEKLLAIPEQKSSEPLCFFNNEDWSTLGNWCNRYGKDTALLCAANSPMDVPYSLADGTEIDGAIGPNYPGKDSLRRWVHWLNVPDNKNVLYCPSVCTRIEAEWDDHGEVYPRSLDGPDVWAKIFLPKGKFQISLYFFNPNGHSKAESQRDFLVEIRKTPHIKTGDKQQKFLKNYYIQNELPKIQTMPALARTRVNSFAAGGVYKNFVVDGEFIYYIRVCRNNSFNTILNGIFVTQLLDENRIKYPLDSYLQYAYVYPQKRKLDIEKSPDGKKEIEIYNSLEKSLHAGITHLNSSSLNGIASEFYRFLISSQNKNRDDLIYNMRWNLKIMNSDDHTEFKKIMYDSWLNLQEIYPLFQSKEWVSFSPHTIPFSIDEVEKMKELNIEWKDYLPGKKTKEEEDAMHAFLSKQIKKAKK